MHKVERCWIKWSRTVKRAASHLHHKDKITRQEFEFITLQLERGKIAAKDRCKCIEHVRIELKGLSGFDKIDFDSWRRECHVSKTSPRHAPAPDFACIDTPRTSSPSPGASRRRTLSSSPIQKKTGKTPRLKAPTPSDNVSNLTRRRRPLSSGRYEPRLLSSSGMRRPSSMDSSIKLGQSRPSFFPDDFHAHGADDGVDGGVDTSLSDDSSSGSCSGSDDLYVPKRKASPKEDLNLTDSLRLLDWKSQQMVDPHARTPRSKKARNHGSRRRYKPQLVSIDVEAVTPRVLSSRDVTPEASSRPQSGSDHQKLTGLKILDKALGSRRSCESAAPGATAARNGKDSRSHHKHKHSKDQRHKAERQHRHRSQKDGNSQLDEASYTEVEHVSIESSSTTPSSRPARVENYAPSELDVSLPGAILSPDNKETKSKRHHHTKAPRVSGDAGVSRHSKRDQHSRHGERKSKKVKQKKPKKQQQTQKQKQKQKQRLWQSPYAQRRGTKIREVNTKIREVKSATTAKRNKQFRATKKRTSKSSPSGNDMNAVVVDLNQTLTPDQIRQLTVQREKKRPKPKKRDIVLSSQDLALVRKYVTFEESSSAAKDIARVILERMDYALPGLTTEEYVKQLGSADSWI